MPLYYILLRTSSIRCFYTERNDSVNLQYQCFLNLREDFMFTLQHLTCMLLCATVQDVESTVQEIETNVTLQI